MVAEGLVHRFILLLFFIATMTSVASLERLNNGTTLGNMVCATLSNATCFAGSCEGGVCAPCPFNPLFCCIQVVGNCTSAGGLDYGICNPTCAW
jgi:hypothetical protein